MDAESSRDAGKATWQTPAVLGAGADAEVTPPQENKPMQEPGLQPRGLAMATLLIFLTLLSRVAASQPPVGDGPWPMSTPELCQRWFG